MNLSNLLIFFIGVVDSYNPKYYYMDPRMHSLGNHGIGGSIHAQLAPLFTHNIDRIAYRGLNIRKKLLSEYNKHWKKLDLCCGVGFSTPEENGIGIDCSFQMIDKARQLFPKKVFEIGNAESYMPDEKVDMTTLFYAFHEIPQFARLKILDRVLSYTKKEVRILDIAPDYKPSDMMLMGEPYLLEYQKNIYKDLENFEADVLIPGHIHMWTLKID